VLVELRANPRITGSIVDQESVGKWKSSCWPKDTPTCQTNTLIQIKTPRNQIKKNASSQTETETVEMTARIAKETAAETKPYGDESRKSGGEGKTLHIGNLSYDTREQDLRDLFDSHGKIESARIVTDRDSGRSRGFGFVTYENANDAEDARKALDGRDLLGRDIRVEIAKDRGSGGGRFGGGRGGGGGYRGRGRGGGYRGDRRDRYYGDRDRDRGYDRDRDRDRGYDRERDRDRDQGRRRYDDDD